MKKIFSFLLLLFSITVFSQNLGNPAVIGQTNRNQKVGKGFQVTDTLLVNGKVRISVIPTASTKDTFVMVVDTAGYVSEVGKNTFLAGAGSSSVTDFIFTDGNGFDGTVTSSTTTPTLSLVLDSARFASVKRVLDSLIDVNARIKNGDSIYFFRTFAQLKSAMTAHTLKSGADYQMTDFQTIYPQPDYDDTGEPKDSVAVKTSAVEQLVFHANSDSTFDNYVSSVEYPTDIIHFDWSYTITEVMDAPAKGRIVYREDTLGNILEYDWRSVLFKRYRQDGIYSSWIDNDSISAEFPTFPNGFLLGYNTITGYLNGYVAAGMTFYLPNNVFRGQAFKNKMDNVFCCTFMDRWNENSMGDGCVAITVLGGGAYNYFGHGAFLVTFAGNAESNYFGDQIDNCTFGARCNENSIWDKMTNFTAGTDFKRNIQYGEWSNSTVGNSFTDGVIYGLTDSIIAGNDNFKIEIKSGLGITIGNNNSNVNFGGTKHIRVGDMNNIKNVTFGGSIDGNFWSTGFTVGAHPQMYQTTTKAVIRASNGSVYMRYFDGLVDSITIVN